MQGSPYQGGAAEKYAGMLARCRALQIFLEVAVVDKEKVLQLFEHAGLPEPGQLLQEVQSRFGAEDQGLSYEQFQSFLRVQAVARRSHLPKEQATKALLGELTQGLGYADTRTAGARIASSPPEPSLPPRSPYTPTQAVPSLDMSSTTEARGGELSQDGVRGTVDALARQQPEVNEQLEAAFYHCSRGQSTVGSFEWGETLRRLSSTGQFGTTPKGLPQKANAIFSEVAEADIRDARVDLEGFKEALTRFAPTVFPEKTQLQALTALIKLLEQTRLLDTRGDSPRRESPRYR